MLQDSFSYLLPDQKLKSIAVKDDDIVQYRDGKKKRKVYQNCKYDELELRQIQQFRVYAEGKHDITKVPDHTIIRYLYSFDFKHSEALDKLKIYLEWYSNPKIQRIDNTTLQLINQGACYTYGRDKAMRPIIYLNVALLDMTKYTLEDYLSAINAIVTLCVEKLFIKGKLENYLFIIDTEGKNFSSLPLTVVKEMVLKMSYVFSMRMGKLLLINCNYLIKLMYSTVSPFLAEITREKINLLSVSQVEDGKMRDFIDINQLQQKYGGFRENLVKKWPPALPGKEQIKKDKQLQQYDFEQDKDEIMDQSEYFSCQNDEEMFYKYDQKIIASEACCSTEQCTIY